MEKGLRIPQKERTKTTNSILVSLMNQLEKVSLCLLSLFT
jgi:vacuolar protein sorting-associated protein VTA1